MNTIEIKIKIILIHLYMHYKLFILLINIIHPLIIEIYLRYIEI